MEAHYYLVAPLAYTGQADGGFTYSCAQVLAIGQVVSVPLGRRQSQGVVIAEVPPPEFATRPITSVVDLAPLPSHLMALAAWMSQYYAASPASVWSTLLPSGLGRRRRPRAARAVTERAPQTEPLTPEQVTALAEITASPSTTHLLQGVTGSGKTRLYLELAAQALASGRSVIVLVPEIILTPQLVGEFTAKFGDLVITTHSRLTEAERHLAWQAALMATDPRIAIGPRSSLFLPLADPGLIIIDECHETSYKQEQNPRYWAPAVAAKLANLRQGKLILGSATPGLNETFLAEEGRIGRSRLTSRAGGQPAPVATTVDLRQKDLLRTSKFLTEPLIEVLGETLAEGRQSLLFINRRGSASSQICGDCGTVTLCPDCQLPLTFHADLLKLICHHCNYRTTPPAVCVNCSSANLRYLGGGTKRVEAEVIRLFPQARVARLDRDLSSLPHIEQVYHGLQSGELDIVIGTQMIAKGLDLPRIDTVGIVSADTMLHLPDYTAAERTFGLLAQVIGRSGRGDRPGRAIIQSYSPEHPAIKLAATADYEAFARAELAERQRLDYPPYTYALKLNLTAKSREAAIVAATQMADGLRTRPGLVVMGPAPALLETIHSQYSWVVIVKSKTRAALVAIAATLPAGWAADLDPINLL